MVQISPKFSHQIKGHQECKEPIPLDFRAPPPSPIGSSSRGSSVTNEEVLTEFLEHSLRVPDLILPDRVFPKQKTLQDIPTIDFRTLNSPGFEAQDVKVRDALCTLGCFQVINHGISLDLISKAAEKAGMIFRLPPEKKRMAVRSPDKPFGFEEVSSDQEELVSEMSEEFVWSGNHGFKLKMEGIWPTDYSSFSEKMELLASAIEKVAKEIMSVLNENVPKHVSNNGRAHYSVGCMCHIYKHPCGVPVDQCISSLRYDVIRMMIRGSEYSHALSLHLCDGSSEFQVYSKKGWLSFTPWPNALVVTAGDQIQALSNGRYKHVIGRPIYTSKLEDCISMSFLYTPPRTNNSQQEKKEKIISLRDQALFAIFVTIACQFVLFIYNKL